MCVECVKNYCCLLREKLLEIEVMFLDICIMKFDWQQIYVYFLLICVRLVSADSIKKRKFYEFVWG